MSLVMPISRHLVTEARIIYNLISHNQNIGFGKCSKDFPKVQKVRKERDLSQIKVKEEKSCAFRAGRDRQGMRKQ